MASLPRKANMLRQKPGGWNGEARTVLRVNDHSGCRVFSRAERTAPCALHGGSSRPIAWRHRSDCPCPCHLLPCFVVGVVAGGVGRRKVEAAWTGFLPPFGFFASRLPRLRSLVNAVLPAYGVFWVALWVIAWPVAERSSPAPAVVWQAPSRGAPTSSARSVIARERFERMRMILELVSA